MLTTLATAALCIATVNLVLDLFVTDAPMPANYR